MTSCHTGAQARRDSRGWGLLARELGGRKGVGWGGPQVGRSPPSAVWHEQVSHPLWAFVSASVGVDQLSQGALPHTPFPSPTGDLHLSLNYWPPTPSTHDPSGPLIMTSGTRQSLESQTVVQGPAASASPAGNAESQTPPQTS